MSSISKFVARFRVEQKKRMMIRQQSNCFSPCSPFNPLSAVKEKAQITSFTVQTIDDQCIYSKVGGSYENYSS